MSNQSACRVTQQNQTTHMARVRTRTAPRYRYSCSTLGDASIRGSPFQSKNLNELEGKLHLGFTTVVVAGVYT